MAAAAETCPGCWDEDCTDCNDNPDIDPVTGQRWSSMPSADHGRLINRASDKQVNFLVSLGVDRAEAERFSKSAASAKIDTLLEEQGPPKPSQKQLDFFENLLAEKNHALHDTEVANARNDRKACSWAIDILMRSPRKTDDREHQLEDGIYKLNDEFYKVYVTVHGARQKVAKRMVRNADGSPVKNAKGNATWEYEGKRPLRSLRPEHKLSLEEAKRFGHIYGVCCVCGATLTKEESIEAGIGPVCGSMF